MSSFHLAGGELGCFIGSARGESVDGEQKLSFGLCCVSEFFSPDVGL